MKPAWAENLAWDHIRRILGDGAQHLSLAAAVIRRTSLHTI